MVLEVSEQCGDTADCDFPHAFGNLRSGVSGASERVIENEHRACKRHKGIGEFSRGGSSPGMGLRLASVR